MIKDRIDILEEYQIQSDVIHDSESETKDGQHFVYRSMFIVTYSIMASLAVCLVFAANLLNHIENYFPDQHLSDAQKELFEHGISMAAIGTFIFRGGHNIFFVKLRPRMRFVIALLSMICMMTVIIVAFFIMETHNIWWIYIAYGFGGCTFGCNEPNLFRSTAYLGEQTKIWLFYGIGAGFNFTMVVGLYLLSIGMPLIYLYIHCIVLCSISIIIYLVILKHHDKIVEKQNYILFNNAITINSTCSDDDDDDEHKSLTWNDVKSQLKEWRNWLITLLPFGVVVLCNYLMLNGFGMIPFYIMISGRIPILNNIWINRDLLFSITGILWVFGSFLAYAMLHYSSKITNFVLRYPATIIFMHIAGATLSSCAFFIQPLLNVIGSAIVNFAFGFIYKSSVTYIERNIQSKYRLISLSLLFMFGDIGATIGVNTWPFIVQMVCDKNTQTYYCDNSD